MQIKREKETLHKVSPLTGSRGSSDVRIEILDDGSYATYGKQMHCGYIDRGTEKETILLIDSNGLYLIPGAAYNSAGPIRLSMLLTDPNGESIMTNELIYVVRPAPYGTIILPSEATWQELVAQYVTSLTEGIIQEVDTKIEQFTEEYGDAYTPIKSVVYEPNEQLLNVESGDDIPTILGKIDTWYTSVIQNDSKNVKISNYLTSSNDVNLIIDTGLYIISSGGSLPSNLPIQDSGYLEVFKWSDTYVYQRYTARNSGITYSRLRGAGTWLGWILPGSNYELIVGPKYICKKYIDGTFEMSGQLNTPNIVSYPLPIYTIYSGIGTVSYAQSGTSVRNLDMEISSGVGSTQIAFFVRKDGVSINDITVLYHVTGAWKAI